MSAHPLYPRLLVLNQALVLVAYLMGAAMSTIHVKEAFDDYLAGYPAWVAWGFAAGLEVLLFAFSAVSTTFRREVPSTAFWMAAGMLGLVWGANVTAMLEAGVERPAWLTVALSTFVPFSGFGAGKVLGDLLHKYMAQPVAAQAQAQGAPGAQEASPAPAQAPEAGAADEAAQAPAPTEPQAALPEPSKRLLDALHQQGSLTLEEAKALLGLGETATRKYLRTLRDARLLTFDPTSNAYRLH